MTIGLSSLPILSLKATTPLVFARPAKSILIFTVTGTPCSIPSSLPERVFLSASAASFSASSAIRSTIALIFGLIAATRASVALVSSTLETAPIRISRACSVASSRHSSVMSGSSLP
jgi:hypothetical protein